MQVKNLDVFNAKDNDGKTVLRLAAENGSIKKIAQVIAAGDFGTQNPQETAEDKITKTANILITLIKHASGYIQDNTNVWELIEEICRNIPEKNKLDIVVKTLEKVDNTWRRDKLLSFIPEEQRNLARASLSLTVLEKIRELGKSVYGNPSEEAPKGPGIKGLAPMRFFKSSNSKSHK